MDPQDDMEKVERKKDKLLNEAYKWITETDEYAALTNWDQDGSGQPSRRLMWIKGPAGTGKTMLLIGIIRELTSQPTELTPYLTHFFYQSTSADLNSATATLRSLVWLLLIQQPHLIPHLRSKYEHAGSSLFTGEAAFIALSSVFKNMLKDPALLPVYFVVDALDECENRLADLIELVGDSLNLSDKVKWIVSSRSNVELKRANIQSWLIKLDAQKLQSPVKKYIDYKLSMLLTRQGYTERILAQIKEDVSKRAENIFLWVALVFKELDAEDGISHPYGSDALEIIREIPAGLSRIYDHIMAKIENGSRKDPQDCKNVLVVATLAFRPVTFLEIAVLSGLPCDKIKYIVKKCGSFFSAREETIYLTHQSAKEYLDENFESKLQTAGATQGHSDISMRAIESMSQTLKKNMYSLDYGFIKPQDKWPLHPNPLASVRYCCVFWVDHLIESIKGTGSKIALTDDGKILNFLSDKFLY